MRSSYFVKAIMCIIIAAGFGSCRGVANKPKIVEVMKPEQESIKLIYQNRTRGNGIQLGFSGEEVSLNNPKLLAENEEELEYKLQKIEKPEDYVLPEGVSEANFFEVTPTKQMGIGEVLLLSGSASDKTNESLDFQLSFTTVNSKPARLKITELRPVYGSKKSEFIEFIVEEGGNLFGIKLSNVGAKGDEQHHYTFPSAEVKKGERVVFHWRSIEEGNKDEVDATIISKGSQACENARDFWGNIQKVPVRNPNVITVKNPSDNTIQDAVLYFNIRPKGKEKQKPEFKWTFPEIETAAKEAVAAGVWKMKGEAFCEEDFFCCNITPSASIGRSNDTGEWKVYTAKEVTMGEKNN